MICAINICNLSKNYKNRRFKTVKALCNLSLSVNNGEIFGFLGPNGSGKSTTIKTLMGLIRPSAGEVSLYGLLSSKPAARKQVGYLPENPAFYDFLTAREYLNFVGHAFGMNKFDIVKQTDRVLSLLDLQVSADRLIRGYSKGMVQRLGLAQAMLHDPDLYILDEPMSGLDPIGRALVKDIILDLKQKGKTVFFSTHVTADAERICDRVGVIIAGVLQEQQIVSDLLREGVRGYHCRVSGISLPQHLHDEATDCGNGIFELFIARTDFDSFAALVVQQNGSFELIEPRRNDLEDYFLSLVNKVTSE